MSTYNYYVALLRVWMCFEVICCHFLSCQNNIFSKFFGQYVQFAVPVFFLLSFYFFRNRLEQKFSIADFRKRMLRLIIPLAVWAVIYYVLLSLVSGKMIPFQALLWQMVTGHSPELNESMWFQFDLIVLTVLFFFLFVYIKKYFSYVLCILLLLSFILQYSGLNYFLFSRLRYELSYPLGRLCEMIPYACAGCLISQYVSFRNRGYKSLLLLFGLHVFSILLLHIIGFLMKGVAYNNFDYMGLGRLFASSTLCIFCLMLGNVPFPFSWTSVCKKLTNYTLGIYCSHRLVAVFLVSGLLDLNINDPLLTCILVYVCSYLFCMMLDKLGNKYCHIIVA